MDKKKKPTKKPFKAIRKVKGGYHVIAKSTGQPLSKKPMSRDRALAQLRAVEWSKHHAGG